MERNGNCGSPFVLAIINKRMYQIFALASSRISAARNVPSITYVNSFDLGS